ncbi:MAG: single-stranded DNA-binding protein [Planctomycetota bacterium]|jgi:single-strand DNA-binding protein
MANYNKVLLMGNLTRDPELRYTPSGTPVCEFGLATNRTYTTRDGQQREETCFVDVTMWGRRGVVISEYFTKGRPIFVEGRLRYDSWESAEGRRSKLSVVAENFEFVGGRGGAPAEGAGEGQRRSRGRPARTEPEQEEPAEEGFDVADDEIPF